MTVNDVDGDGHLSYDETVVLLYSGNGPKVPTEEQVEQIGKLN